MSSQNYVCLFYSVQLNTHLYICGCASFCFLVYIYTYIYMYICANINGCINFLCVNVFVCVLLWHFLVSLFVFVVCVHVCAAVWVCLLLGMFVCIRFFVFMFAWLLLCFYFAPDFLMTSIFMYMCACLSIPWVAFCFFLIVLQFLLPFFLVLFILCLCVFCCRCFYCCVSIYLNSSFLFLCVFLSFFFSLISLCDSLLVWDILILFVFVHVCVDI